MDPLYEERAFDEDVDGEGSGVGDIKDDSDLDALCEERSFRFCADDGHSIATRRKTYFVPNCSSDSDSSETDPVPQQSTAHMHQGKAKLRLKRSGSSTCTQEPEMKRKAKDRSSQKVKQRLNKAKLCLKRSRSSTCTQEPETKRKAKYISSQKVEQRPNRESSISITEQNLYICEGSNESCCSEIIPLQMSTSDQLVTSKSPGSIFSGILSCNSSVISKPSSMQDSEIKKPKSTGQRPKRPCIFCGIFQSQLVRHMEKKHGDEPLVKSGLELPAKEKIRYFHGLRKKGIYKYNMDQIKSGGTDKDLLRQRKQGDGKLKICQNCQGFYSREYFFEHAKRCTAASITETADVPSIPIPTLTSTHVSCSDSDFGEILESFRLDNDGIGNLCKTDTMILEAGKHLYSKYRSKTDKVTEGKKKVRSEMRRLATLYMSMKRLVEKDYKDIDFTSHEILNKKYFKFLELAIEDLSKNADGSLKSGAKLAFGYTIKNAIKVMSGVHLLENKDSSYDELLKFQAVLKLRWPTIFADAEYQQARNRQERLRKPHELPIEEDVIKLRTYTLDRFAEITNEYHLLDSSSFKECRDLLVARLTLFNARRGGEPCRLLMNDWNDAKNNVWLAPEHRNALERKEHDFKIIYEGGKGTNHLVPVLVPKDCVQPLSLMSKSSIRKMAGVNELNSYLFPSTKHSLSHVSGWHAVNNVCKAAALTKNITANSMRHRVSTLYANLDVSEDQRKDFYRHMGHSLHTNENVYQCPPALREIVNVGAHLANFDHSTSSMWLFLTFHM